MATLRESKRNAGKTEPGYRRTIRKFKGYHRILLLYLIFMTVFMYWQTALVPNTQYLNASLPVEEQKPIKLLRGIEPSEDYVPIVLYGEDEDVPKDSLPDWFIILNALFFIIYVLYDIYKGDDPNEITPHEAKGIVMDWFQHLKTSGDMKGNLYLYNPSGETTLYDPQHITRKTQTHERIKKDVIVFPGWHVNENQSVQQLVFMVNATTGIIDDIVKMDERFDITQLSSKHGKYYSWRPVEPEDIQWAKLYLGDARSKDK